MVVGHVDGGNFHLPMLADVMQSIKQTQALDPLDILSLGKMLRKPDDEAP